MTAPDEYLNIDTPENVAFGYEIVGIGSRFMAALVDSLIIGLIYLIVLLALLFVVGNIAPEGSLASSFVIGLFGLLGFFFIWGYYIFFEMRWNGRSPGKQLVKLRVIRRDGSPVTLAESTIRNLVRLIDFLPFAYGVGVVTMFIDGQSRRLGDLAASTLVVRDQEEVTLESLGKLERRPEAASGSPASEPFTPANDREAMVATWPLGRLTESDILLVEEYFRRRQDMSNGRALAEQIFRKLLIKMQINDPGIPKSYPATLETLQAIVKLYRDRGSGGR